jgi:hypothetical protein
MSFSAPDLVLNFESKQSTFTLSYSDMIDRAPEDAKSKRALIKLEQASFVSWFPNLSSTKTLAITQGNAVAVNISIPAGNYDSVTLASTIQVALRAAAGGYGVNYSVTYSTVTGGFTISVAGGGTIAITAATSSLLSILGFDPVTNLGQATSHSSVIPADLSGLKFIHVMCTWCDATYVNNTRIGMLAKIPLEKQTGSVEVYKAPDDAWVLSPKLTNSVSFALLDSSLQPVPASGLTMHFQLYIKWLMG